MRWLTRERGREVRAADGSRVGRVADLTAAIGTGEDHPTLTRVIVRAREGAISFDRHDLAVGLDTTETPIVLTEHARATPALLRDDELLLVRDVLDTQIVDLDGHRVARVADIALEPADDGTIEVAGVEVGASRVLRRLHLGWASLHGVEYDRFIDWNDLHLASPRGHGLQLASPRSAIHRLTEPELTALLEHLDLGSETALPRRHRRRHATRWQRHRRPRSNR